MRQIEKHPVAGVLLINYNQWELTRKCVKSVLDSRGVRIVIGLVDINSSESVPNWVKNNPDILFHGNSGNLGFIAGKIKAYEIVSSENVDLVILLNNDTEVEPDTLRLLTEHFETHKETGLVTPTISYAENRRDYLACGRFLHPMENGGGRQLFINNTSDLPEHAVEVDQVSGCAMMMRTEMFKKIGYQNPGLLIYHEDSDSELSDLYSRAYCLVHPAHHEGFGFTVPGAFTWGLPVVASNTGGLGEFFAETAWMVDPADIESIANGILLALESGVTAEQETKRKELSEILTWNNCAKKTLNAKKSISG